MERGPGMCAFPWCPAPPDHALSVAHIAAAPDPSLPQRGMVPPTGPTPGTKPATEIRARALTC
eukprot:3035765-Prymnesium_polylepis.1